MGSASSKPAVNVVTDNDEKRSYQAHSQLDSDMASLFISPPISRDGSLSLRNVAAWESTSSSDPKRQLARTILSHSDIRSALTSRSARIADQHVFNNQIDFITQPITNQKSSGRCWLFATTNVLRYEVMKKLKLKEFQLSQVCTMSSFPSSYLPRLHTLVECTHYLTKGSPFSVIAQQVLYFVLSTDGRQDYARSGKSVPLSFR
jgi:C1A family cysteine protease